VCFALLGLGALIVLRWRLPNDEPQFAARGQAADYSSGAGGPSEMPQDDTLEAISEPARLRWFEPRLRPWVISGLVGGHAQAMLLGILGFLVLDRLGLRETPGQGAGPVGIVLMCGAIATLLAQWGVIPRLKLGPRTATLSGILVGAAGASVVAVAQELHTIALGYSIASFGFGLFRPGTTAGTSLAVTRAEQGQASGVVASVAGASFIYAPALGVLLYSFDDRLGFGLIVALCLAVFALGWRNLAADSDLTRES
jgi:hypothetical protein